MLIALGCTALGAGIDAARGTELTKIFSVAYVVGCVVAVLMVRQRGLFTAAVQPPLILFVVVPLAYQYMTKGSGAGIRDIVLNDAVPLVNRFPLMATATGAVLVIAALRWLLGRGQGAVERARVSRATRPPRGEREPRTRREDRPARPTRESRAKADKPDKSRGRGKAAKDSKDTAKDKLDRIANKAETLKSEQIPRSGGRHQSGPIPRSYDGDRDSGMLRRRPEPPANRSERLERPERYQTPPETRGGRRRAPEPEHPSPGVRYRDTPRYER